MVDYQVLLVCSIAGIVFLYALARSVPRKVSGVRVYALESTFMLSHSSITSPRLGHRDV